MCYFREALAMNESVAKFRNAMAESGTELTIDKAAQIYNMGRTLIERAKGMSQLDLWQLLEEAEGLSDEEKEELEELVEVLFHAREVGD
jgi:Zn-dependent M16 (insulinase) family peptidase